jgi:hypothetical protein
MADPVEMEVEMTTGAQGTGGPIHTAAHGTDNTVQVHTQSIRHDGW